MTNPEVSESPGVEWRPEIKPAMLGPNAQMIRSAWGDVVWKWHTFYDEHETWMICSCGGLIGGPADLRWHWQCGHYDHPVESVPEQFFEHGADI